MERIMKETKNKLLSAQIILDVSVFLALGMPVLVLYIMGVPYEGGFFCDDQSIMYPYKEDTISDPVLIAAGVGAVLVMVVIVELLIAIDRRKERQPRGNTGTPFYCIKTIGVFAFGFVINELFVEVIKNQTGALRPNFFSVCQPAFNRSQCNHEFITNYTCTARDHSHKEIRDSRESFPSGHAAVSMFVAVFLVLHLERRLQISFSYVLKPTFQMLLVLVAILCAISRYRDHKHHPQDLVAGCILGTIVASATMRTLGRRALIKEPELQTEPVESKSQNGYVVDIQTPLTVIASELRNGHCSVSPDKDDTRVFSMPT